MGCWSGPRRPARRRKSNRTLLLWCCLFGALLVQQWTMWSLGSGIIVNSDADADTIGTRNHRMAMAIRRTTAASVGTTRWEQPSSARSSLPTPNSTASDSNNSPRNKNRTMATQTKTTKKKTKDKHRHKHLKKFSWKDIDYSIPPDCGTFKCFFRSQHSPNQTGYLVATGYKDAQQRAWNISQSIDSILALQQRREVLDDSSLVLAKNHHTSQQQQQQPQSRHHFYSPIPPWQVPVKETIARRLGAKIKARPKRSFFVGSRTLTVQEVDVAPRAEFKVLGCSPSRTMNGCQQVTQQVILEHTTNNRTTGRNNASSTTSPNDAKLAAVRQAVATFRRSIHNTISVLQVHPNLVYDFQVFLNPRGEIYHFDLDRGRRPPPQTDIDACISSLQLYVQVVEATAASTTATTTSA
jgi:hypothetical protein